MRLRQVGKNSRQSSPKFETWTSRIQNRNIQRYTSDRITECYFLFVTITTDVTARISTSFCDIRGSWNIFLWKFKRIILELLLLWPCSPLLGLGRFPVSWSYTQSVGLLGRGINLLQGIYIHTEQHKHKINAHTERLQWNSNPRYQLSRDRRQFMS
jgi:hypothetical protein